MKIGKHQKYKKFPKNLTDKGIGKPEPLKYIVSDTRSRRIDLEHRLVYKVKNNRVYFLQARYHYQPEN